MVGALLQDISNSFSSSLLRSLEDAARDRDVVIVAASLDEEPERERALVEGLVRRRVDGLLLMPATERHDYLADDLRSGLPIVFVDRRPNGVDTDSVTIDNARGSRLAVYHLVAHGHRRIAFLGDLPSIQTARNRLEGFEAAMHARRIPLDPSLTITSLRSPEDAEAAVSRLLDSEEPPTAIFAARNSLAVGTIRALHRLGKAGQIAVVGFDDFPLADIVDPPLTVVRQNVGAIGAEVAQRLFARIDGDTSPPRHVVLAPSSSNAAPARSAPDLRVAAASWRWDADGRTEPHTGSDAEVLAGQRLPSPLGMPRRLDRAQRATAARGRRTARRGSCRARTRVGRRLLQRAPVPARCRLVPAACPGCRLALLRCRCPAGRSALLAEAALAHWPPRAEAALLDLAATLGGARGKGGSRGHRAHRGEADGQRRGDGGLATASRWAG